MKERIRIEGRRRFWKDRQYQIAESGRGWAIERPCRPEKKDVPDLEMLLDKFFKKRSKWE